LPALRQDPAVAPAVALEVEAVVTAWCRALHTLDVVGAGRGLHVAGDGDADRGVDVHVGQDDVKGLRVRGDGGPGYLVVFAEVQGGAFSWGGDLEGEG
jgi:hypothetical protein